MSYTPGPWKYEPETKTIRALPSNYWLATMDSFDGAVDHVANANLIAACPELLARLEQALVYLEHPEVKAIPFALPSECCAANVRAAIANARKG